MKIINNQNNQRIQKIQQMSYKITKKNNAAQNMLKDSYITLHCNQRDKLSVADLISSFVINGIAYTQRRK